MRRVLLLHAASFSLFLSATVWLLYVALEPYLRRRRPEGCISWNRLLSGRMGDPLIGRDLLIGVTAGVLIAAISYLRLVLPTLVGTPTQVPFWIDDRVLLGLRLFICRSHRRTVQCDSERARFLLCSLPDAVGFSAGSDCPTVFVLLLIFVSRVLAADQLDGPLVWDMLILALDLVPRCLRDVQIWLARRDR